MSKRAIAIIIAAVLFFAAIAWSAFSMSLSKSVNKSLTEISGPTIAQTTIEGSDSSNKIARVEIAGTIENTGPASPFQAEGYNHERTLEMLDEIKDDASIKGELYLIKEKRKPEKIKVRKINPFLDALFILITYFFFCAKTILEIVLIS